MTVYKGYLRIIKRNMNLILMYLGIFMAITVMFQTFAEEGNYGNFQAESVKVAVVDEDGGAFSSAFQDYLRQFHEVKKMKKDKALMQEELFYRNTEYIVRIPADFFDACVKGGEKLQITNVPGSYTAFYVDQQINSFLYMAGVYDAAGLTEEEMIQALGDLEPARVELTDGSGTAGEMPAYGWFFRYIPYLFLSVFCYVMGNVLSAFHKGDLPKRMQASAVSQRRQSMEGLLAAATIGAGLWGIVILAAFLLYGKRMTGSPGLAFYLLNSLAMLLVSLAVSYLVGMVVGGKNMQNKLNGIVNVLTLGMCFLCGTFVPLDVMSKSVKTVAQFLPVYWYELVNEYLVEYDGMAGSMRGQILEGIGIQLVFAAALICVVLALAKWKKGRV